MSTERQKMLAGEWYTCLDPELERLRKTAQIAVHAHNTAHPNTRSAIAPTLAALFAHCDPTAMIESPFHCPYGINISLGAGVYLNANCVILDTAPVTIGDGTLIGPAVQIYCAEHHKDAAKRAAGLEIAKPVTIGKRVWIGGGSVILPGITIGNDAIIGAGSVVTKDVASGSTVVGNPTKPTV